MATRAGGGSNGGGSQGIPAASRKMVQSLKEIVNGVTEAEIYSTLKECNMDPNEAVNRLLSQDTFHEVKSKREKKKEFKDTTEYRPRGGGSTSNRGGRSGSDRYAGRSGSTQFTSSESGGFHGKPSYKRENGTNSYPSSTTPAPRVAPRNTNWNPPTFSYSDSLGLQKEVSSQNSAPDIASVSQPSPVYQSAWLGAPGQKSMAEIVKMGKPQIIDRNISPPVPSVSQTMPSSENYTPDVNPDNEWPSMEQPQAPNTVSGLTSSQSNLPFDYETNEVGPQEESSSEEHVEDHGGPESAVAAPVYENDSYDDSEDKEVEEEEEEYEDEEEEEEEEEDAPLASVSSDLQKLNVQEEKHVVQQPEEVEEEDDAPTVVIPDHLQVHTADCSHLSFGSFGANLNENTNREYYEDASTRTLENNLVQRSGENYDLPSASQASVLKQDDPEVTHGNQYGFPPSTHSHTFDNPQLLNPSFQQSQTPAQTQMSTPFMNVMQAAHTNSLPVRESDLAYSQFSVSQSMPTRYANTASSINDPTISMAEALKTAGLSSSQQPQQTPQGNSNTLPTGPALPQHLAVHPYSQPTLPLGPFANMISYPFLPQSYTYMPSGFQPTFPGNSTYHQQLAAMLPQYKNSVSVSSLPQSAAVASGYGSFGGSTAVPGNYQVNQPAGPTGSTLSYDDVLNAHYKEQLQQNENNPMWVHGAGSRTMPAVPASAYYSLQQSQNQQQQQAGGFRQGQQPTQSYGGAALNYPDFFHTQSGMSQEHQLQLQQNAREASHVGGSQGQPKQHQSQQLWQNGY